MKKTLSILLCVSLLLALLPVMLLPASAADSTDLLGGAGSFDNSDNILFSNVTWINTDDADGDTTSGGCIQLSAYNSYDFSVADTSKVYEIRFKLKLGTSTVPKMAMYSWGTKEYQYTNFRLNGTRYSATAPNTTTWTQVVIPFKFGEGAAPQIAFNPENLTIYLDDLEIVEHTEHSDATGDGKCDVSYYDPVGTNNLGTISQYETDGAEYRNTCGEALPEVPVDPDLLAGAGSFDSSKNGLFTSGAAWTNTDDADGDTSSGGCIKIDGYSGHTFSGLDVNKVYEVRFKLKLETSTDPRMNISNWGTNAYAYNLFCLNSTRYSATTPNTTTWTQYVMPFKFGTATPEIAFNLEGGTAYLDDLEIVEHTEHSDTTGDCKCDFSYYDPIGTNKLGTIIQYNDDGAACRTTCATALAPRFTGTQLSLGTEIAMSWYVSAADASDLTVDFGDYTNSVHTDASAVTLTATTGDETAYGTHKAVIRFPAKNMTDTVTGTLMSGTEALKSHTTSPRDNAQEIVDDKTGTYTDTAKDVAVALLNYAAKAQEYLLTTPGELANSELTDDVRFDADETDAFIQKAQTGTELVSNGQFSGATLNTSLSAYAANNTVTGNSFMTTVALPNSTFTSVSGDAGLVNGGIYDYQFVANTEIDGYSGNVFELWSNAGNSSGNTFFGQKFALTEGETYTISYKVKAEGTASVWAAIRQQPAGGNAKWAEVGSSVSNTDGWMTVSGTYTAVDVDSNYKYLAFIIIVGADNDDTAVAGKISLADISIKKVNNSSYAPTYTYHDVEDGTVTAENRFIGYTLMLRNTTWMRLYFNETATVKCGETTYTSTAKGQYHIVELPAATAADLDAVADYEVYFGGATEPSITIGNLSVLAPAQLAANNSSVDTSLKNVCVALILYAQAVNAYAG